jgi:hypothetical protein
MPMTVRRLTGLAVGVLAYIAMRKPSRRQRRRALQREIYASYERAGADPEFQEEMEEINAAFDGAMADGLDDAL